VDFSVGRRQGARGRRLGLALGAHLGAAGAWWLLLQEGPEGAAGQGDGGEAAGGAGRGGARAARREGEKEGAVFAAVRKKRGRK